MARRLQFDDGSVMGWVAEVDLEKPGNVRTVFDTEAEAVAHENAGVYAARVELFIRSQDWARGQEKRARDLASRFLAFEDTQEDLQAAIAAMQQTLDAEQKAREDARKENMRKAREARELPPMPAAPAVAA